jgi:hypothetical protein
VKKGIPSGEIAFIHDAASDAEKKALFANVRKGQVRVLFGSTAKMGSGTNVQDRLVALHDLDCPWRPADLEQRRGRIVRQGNKNAEVDIYRYVTESTFDAYLYQTIENKQKFIGQVMTSKSPVRSCDDLDEAALSYAEIKALCAGNPLIKEKMNLDIELAKLKVLKANHLSTRYGLEDKLNLHFPEAINLCRCNLAALERDCAAVAAVPDRHTAFPGMEIGNQFYNKKDEAGAALIECCHESRMSDKPKDIGSYAGFAMAISYNRMDSTYELALKGATSHKVSLGVDALGNITRINNVLDGVEKSLANVRERLDNLLAQVENAKLEIEKPFPLEGELEAMTKRALELEVELDMDRRGGGADIDVEDEIKQECDEINASSKRYDIMPQGNSNKLKDAACL